MPLRSTIYTELRDYASNNVARKVGCILDLLKLSAQMDDFPPVTNCIHLANGTLNLNGSFQEGKPEVVRNRLPVKYNPTAAQPTHWLRFLSDLLYPEDIPTVQEFIGYCLIPSNKGQRMMVIKGRGGEGKSQIGVVLSKLFGTNMKDGSIGKISENRFARADLEHILLCVDDDMRMEALRQTNYVKSIVTAQGQMDLERKGKQSYQGWMYARLLAFSNGDLQALYDRSDGFYRRQLVLTTKDKPADRVDDPDIAEKMAAEAEGIFLWAFEGLQRLVRNGFKFTESDRARQNRELVKRDNNNFYDFMEAEDYIRLKFEEALQFLEQYQAKETIISAVVHMDEKTPHMHLSFVPLTPDGRLSAKEIVGNKKKLSWWQDKFWEHMVQKYPDLERGESTSQTGRDHIPPRIFKEMTRLTKQRQKLDQLLAGIGPLNGKKRAAEISELLDSYIPAVEKMRTQLKKYSTAFTSTKAENEKLKKKNKKLSESLDEATHKSVLKQLKDAKLQREYQEALAILERIPPEIVAAYKIGPSVERPANKSQVEISDF